MLEELATIDEVARLDELASADEMKITDDELIATDDTARLDELISTDEIAGLDELTSATEEARPDELASTDEASTLTALDRLDTDSTIDETLLELAPEPDPEPPQAESSEAMLSTNNAFIVFITGISILIINRCAINRTASTVDRSLLKPLVILISLFGKRLPKNKKWKFF